MANRLSRLSGVTYIPGTPEIPALAAGCRTLYSLEGYRDFTSGGLNVPTITVGGVHAEFSKEYGGYWTATPVAGKWSTAWRDNRHRGYGGYNYPLIPVWYSHDTYWVTRQECWEAVLYKPGSPSKVLANSMGWDAGAKSERELAPGTGFRVDVASNTRYIAIGITGRDDILDVNALPMAVILSNGHVNVSENGAHGEDIPLLGRQVLVSRFGDVVIFSVDGIEVSSLALSPGQKVHIAALLYSMMDIIENPVFVPASSRGSEAELVLETLIDPTPRGVSEFRIQAEGQLSQSGMSTLVIKTEAFTLSGYEMYAVTPDPWVSAVGGISNRRGGNSFVLGRMGYTHGFLASSGGASSTKEYASARGAWPAPSVRGSVTAGAQIMTGGEGIFPRPKGLGWWLNGGVMSGETNLASVGKSSSGPFLGGLLSVYELPVITGGFKHPREDSLPVFEAPRLLDYMAIDSAAMFSFVDGIEVSDHLDVYILLNLAFYESVMAKDVMSFSALLELLLSEKVNVSSDVVSSQKEALQYAVNAVSGAVSRYSNFGFTQFATSGGRTYAIKPDGVYAIGADTDDGELISASIDFGASDYGTAQGKRIGSVFAGINTDGCTYIRVVGDHGEEAVYRTISNGHEARAVAAKGIVARHWRLRLELVDASFADLDNLEVEIGVSSRRVNGRR